MKRKQIVDHKNKILQCYIVLTDCLNLSGGLLETQEVRGFFSTINFENGNTAKSWSIQVKMFPPKMHDTFID